ncbi:hypothetical protein FJY71_00205 [candidate division WOR-3 bacterium]|nr:hypothetical protein [candidate division WOR-3 bacterium]
MVGLVSLPGLTGGLDLGQLAGLLDAGALTRIEGLMRQAVLLTWVQTGSGLVSLAGAVGLLRRQKWGWYATALLNLGSVFACLFLAPGVLAPVLALLDPVRAVASAWTIAVLLALIPGAVVVFLLLGPVVRQFERPPAALDPTADRA